MSRRWPVVVLLVVAVGGGFFWWWGNRDDGEMTPEELLRTEQYCPYATRLEESLAAARTGGGLDAELFFVQLGPDLERVDEDAPGQLRADVRTVLDALREAREGDRRAIESPRFDEARNRLAAFQRESCVGGEPGTE